MLSIDYTSVASHTAGILVRDGAHLALVLSSWLAVSLALRVSSGRAAKKIDDETPEASAGPRPTPARESARPDIPCGPTLLEHYGVLGAPCGSWNDCCDIAAKAEPSMDEVFDYFRAALGDEPVHVGSAAHPHQQCEIIPVLDFTRLVEAPELHTPEDFSWGLIPQDQKESGDAPAGPGLLEHYGVLGAPCGSWSGQDIAALAVPSPDEVSDYFRVALADEGNATC